MSTVKYKVGSKCYGFETQLHYIDKEHMFQLEEHLMMEIKEHKHHLNPQPCTGYIHEVVFIDDNGIVGTIKDFKTVGNLIIENHETL